MLGKHHLQAVSHSLDLTGTTTPEFTPALLFNHLLQVTAILHFFPKQLIPEYKLFFTGNWLARKLPKGQGTSLALPCILLSWIQMGLASLRANPEHLSLLSTCSDSQACQGKQGCSRVSVKHRSACCLCWEQTTQITHFPPQPLLRNTHVQ